MGKLFKKLFDPSYKELAKCAKIADQVIALADKYKAMSDEELKNQTVIFKDRLAKGEELDNLMVEAFAVAREASTRVLRLTPFKVQIIGAAAMHFGNIAEMKTGEGKTLTSVMVAYLNALTGKGVHIVTVNEYLASRDAHDMGQVHEFLGLTVGLNLREYDSEQKRAQYACDITYSTNNELGFDYLRDHMVVYKEDMVQRPYLNFAIVDEVDSILIDEARTPLIISGGAKDGPNLYEQANTFCRRLVENEDYEIDEKAKHVSLTPEGISKAENYFHLENLYDISNVELLHRINNALRANFIMKNEVDYVVQDGQVIIVDSFTGRLMHGRQWSEGLHQAVEAKEGVEIKKETRTLATITFQNYFRMYSKLAGMTGTAKTEEEEFRDIYNMLVVEIPTNVPVIRIDDSDLIFFSEEAKYEAIAKDIKERHEKGQPILVGTISIETSELLSSILKRYGIPHNVLNAKQHAREAEIVSHAGEKGAVTIATNMAGRGTDIKLGEGVVELGGLAVLGTERHESRRIDNQLRGRSGRQGDPGYSRFYLSTKDELLVRFGGDRLERMLMLASMKGEDGQKLPISYKGFSTVVETAQKKIEGQNYDRRKSVVEYDEVLRKQREVIYGQRNDILFSDDIEPTILKMMDNVVNNVIPQFALENDPTHIDSIRFMKEFVMRFFDQGYIMIACPNCGKVQRVHDGVPTKCTNHECGVIITASRKKETDAQKAIKDTVAFEEIDGKTISEVQDFILNIFKTNLASKKADALEENYKEFLKRNLLMVVDRHWMDHIDQMSTLRQSVALQSYGQVNPLREYQEIGFEMFNKMISSIESEAVGLINRNYIPSNMGQRERVAKIVGTSGGSSDDDGKKKPVVNKNKKIGPNEPCPCGSGRKYKHCCGRK